MSCNALHPKDPELISLARAAGKSARAAVSR
jgi:hypothetical protein